MKKHLPPLAIVAAIGFAANAKAQGPTVNWTAWTAPANYPNAYVDGEGFTLYNYATSATGSLMLPDNTPVTVTLNGEVSDGSQFGVPASGEDVWSTYPAGTFTSANVPSLPNNGDFIYAGGYGQPYQTISFSQPVSNIVFNVFSLGSGGTTATWEFNQPFVVLSQNLEAWQYGELFTVNGLKLSGQESSGTIQFTGSFLTFSWKVDNPEWAFGWNVGATSASVPEPSTYTLFGIGAVGMLIALRRKKTA